MKLNKIKLYYFFSSLFLMFFLYASYFFSFFKLGSDVSDTFQVLFALFFLVSTVFYIDRTKLVNLYKVFLISAFICFIYLFSVLSSEFYFNSIKSYKFLAVFLFCGYVGVVISSNFSIKYLVFSFVITSFVFMVLYVFFGSSISEENSRVVLGDANPIWVARVLGLFFIFSSISFMFNKEKKYGFLFMALFSLYLIFLTGSRGPIFSAFFALLFLTLFINFSMFKNISFFIVIIFLLVLFIKILGYGDFMDRVLYSDSSGRDVLYSHALNMFYSNPLGVGLGGYESALTDFSKYPHNIILESLVEGGVLFTIVFFYFIYKALKSSIAVLVLDCNSREKSFLFCIFIYAFMNSMFSGDLTSPKELYFLAFFFLFKKNSSNKNE